MALTDHRILTFDVVGTLIDFEAGILGYLHPLAKQAGLKLEDAALLAAFGRAEHVQQQAAPHLPFTQMLAPIYAELAAELGLPAEAAEGFRDSIPAWPAFPDSVAALQRLGARHRLVALTNADVWAFERMAETLEDPFDDFVTAEHVGVNKPDPQVFAYCRGRQSHLGYTLADFLHVAQSQYHDIGVAKRLGFATCWIERRRGQAGFGATPAPETITQPDYHFRTLEELADAMGCAK